MDAYERAALANEARADVGLSPRRRLLKGRGAGTNCPIARTVSAGSELDCVADRFAVSVFDAAGDWVAEVPTPGEAAEFVRRFDGGEYPARELVA